MWDGFWVHSFKRKTLIISCSFDRIYYRDFDIIFKQVIFFNVPEQWQDTNIHGDNLIRIATREEFEQAHPGFDIRDRHIFAIDIHFYKNDSLEKHVFFILAKHVYLIRCEASDNNPVPEYSELVKDEVYPSHKNRVGVK